MNRITDVITMASMLKIPVVMHNVLEENIFRPHVWSSFGTKDMEGADLEACKAFPWKISVKTFQGLKHLTM